MNEPAGRREVSVEIGGIRLRAESIDPDLSFTVSPEMLPFCCPPERADITVTVARRNLDEAPPPGRPLFRSGGLWDLWDCEGEYLFRFTSPAIGPAPYKVLRLDRRLEQGRMEIHDGYPAYAGPGRPFDPLEYPVDELMVVHWLSRGRGIELHGCGIVDERGDGQLFIGQSGAGKSTVAGFWRGPAVVLSDDRIVVREHEAKLWMYGTPWHGEAQASAARAVPIKRIFLLQQAERAAIVPLPEAAAVSRLFACSFVPFHDPAALEFTLDFLGQLVRRVECVELRFARDPSFLALLGIGP